jgi:hypothetical protein
VYMEEVSHALFLSYPSFKEVMLSILPFFLSFFLSLGIHEFLHLSHMHG